MTDMNDSSKSEFHVAIDGPVAAGKGTVSRQLAAKLEFLYVDTGATYRVAALIAEREGLDPTSDQDEIVQELRKQKLDMHIPKEGERDGRLITVLLEREDVSWEIREERISSLVPKVAKIPAVRDILVKKQRQIANGKSVVMEGRDITTRVLPEAELKVFLSASELVRAKRRYTQLLDRGESIDFEEVREELAKRDELDTSREIDPLQVAEDAWVIDSSDLSIPQVVEMIAQKVHSLRGA